MKRFLYIGIIFTVFCARSQEKNLTNNELSHAVRLYAEMVKSETYKSFKNNIRNVSLKLGEAREIYPSALKISDKEEIRQWLEPNIGLTTFASVEEGVEMIHLNFLLMQKLRTENRQVYEYIGRGSRDQTKLIIAPEFKSLRQILDENPQLRE